MSFDFGVSLAMIGDEDVTCSIQLEAYPSYRKIKSLDYFFEKFADINAIIRLTDEVLEKKPEFDVIMLFPILWDIIYMDFNEFNTPTIHLKRDYNTLDYLVSLIASSQKRWKVTYPNVTIFWCMPFTPDFYRFNKYTDFWVEQNAGRNFYRVIRKLGSDLYTNVPVCENSFYQNIDEPLRYIHSCTKDGLHTTEEFISNFVSVFENRVYPVSLKSNRKYISDASPSTIYDYSNRRLLPMRIFDYSSKTSGRSGTSDNLSYESDSQNSKQFNTDQDNTGFERSSNESQNFHIQSNNYQSANLNYERDSQSQFNTDQDKTVFERSSNESQNFHIQSNNYQSANLNNERDSQSYPPYQTDDCDSYKNQQTQSSNFDDNNYCDSYTPHGFTNDNSNQSITNQFLPVGSDFSLTDKKNDNVSSKSITEALSSYLKAEDSNASDNSTKFQQQNNPQYNSRTSWEDQSLSHLSHSPSSSLKDPNVKQNIGSDFFKGLSEIPPNIFNNIKNALNFLGSSSNTDKKDDSSSNNTDGKDSPYYEIYIKNFFSPLHWKDIFLSGDENIALDCLKTSVNSLNRIPYKKGMVIVMITTSEKMVSLAQEALKPLVESNTIGLNDEITFGVPLVIVDTTCNIQLRLNQIKQQSLADLSALLVFGDDLLDLSSLLFIELTHLVKQLLSSSRGDVNKVVISQSGSASVEVSAQSIFNVTFLSPKRKIDKEKEVEKFNNSVGLTDFLKISCDLEISNDCHSNVHSSSLTPVVERQDERVETRVPKVSSRDKSCKTYKVESKKSTSRHRSPQKTSRSSHSSASTSTSSKPSKSTVKLEDIFKRARVSIPEEKKKENEAFNKEFMKKLEKMPRSIQKTYMAEGKEVLMDHESTYKTYKDVPDLHPLYEEKYEFFIKLFEEAYGHTYNPKHLQSTWKRFWIITVSCIKDLEWLDRKKELQEQFMVKHGMKSDVKSKEIESDKVKKKRNEDKKIKVEKTKNNKNIESKSEEGVKKISVEEGNKAKTLKGKDTKENKVAISKSEEMKKKTIKSEENNVKTMKVDIKENKTIINKSIGSNKKATEREGNDVKTLKEDNEEYKRTINKSVENSNKASETEGSKIKTTKEEDIKENINKEAEVKKEEEIPKMEDKEKNREDTKSQSKNTNKTLEDKEVNKLKKRSSSPGPLENISKKVKRIEIKPPESKSPPIITIDDDSHNVTSGKNENPSKISECNNKNEVKNSDSSLKAVVEMRRKLIIDAEEEDKYPFAPLDGKANEKNQKKDCRNESKEIVLPEKQNSKTVSCEKKSTPPIMKDKSKVEEKIFSRTLKNTDSLVKKVDMLLTKTSQLSESKSLSGTDKKLSYSDRSLDKSLSDSRKDDDKHLSSTLYRQSKTGNMPSLTRKEDKYHVGDKHSKLDTYKRKSSEKDDFQSKRKSDSDKSLASIERDNFHSRSDTDRGKYLHKREDRSSFNRVENSSLRKSEASIFQDRKGDKPSYKNSLLNLLSSKEDNKSKSEHDETDLSFLISPFTKTPANKFSTELSSSVKPLFPIQISQGNSSGSNLRKNENQPETKEDFMKLYVNTCSELSKKKSQTIKAGTSSSRTSTSSILEELDSHVKPSFHKASDSTKSKIVINLGKPKMQFSLYEALNSLESVCSDIGVMGAALNSIVETSRALLPNFYESYKIFTDSDSELLVNIAINKLKSFSSQSTEGKVKYQKTIALAEKLLEEAKKSTLKGPPPSANVKPVVKSRINVEAVAKATVGLSVKDTYQFIKNTFVYKGLSEPSKTEIEQVFEEVSKFHFEFALKS
ncbi:hypothetical protein Anas_10899 [Armadillidium nasatum]|uniref:Uncharacterized protein n=1 Tax=Armadillidium nasatum TaxID=96803 RepID=A0A5N5T8J0_9CRUS|nr:hypothetical protein Anas_10899 [Armadillidium nasatum]